MSSRPTQRSGPWKVVGINFDHMHMGDNLRFAHDHPDVEIAGLCDERPERMASAQATFGIPTDRLFSDPDACLRATDPDLVILCPSTGTHPDWIERVAPYAKPVMIEKPFAADLAGADRMTAAMRAGRAPLAVNWPLAWYPPHVTAKRLIDAGTIGTVTAVNYYDGNRGPLYHVEDKRETDAAFRTEEKAKSWFYSRAQGGGSQLDYLGYGATLGTWFLDGALPLEVTSVAHVPDGLEVDEHSITIVRYAAGLCRLETRWGTFTDPWTHQPQPKCGFEIVGTDGTLTSYDYEDVVRLQTREAPETHAIPVDALAAPYQNPVQYIVHCLASGAPIEGPLSPALSRIGQQIVDTAVRSASEGRTLPLEA